MYMLENGKMDVAAYLRHVKETKERIHGAIQRVPIVTLPAVKVKEPDEKEEHPAIEIIEPPQIMNGNITAINILQMVAYVTGISVIKIKSIGRQSEVVRARQIAAVIIKELTSLSYPSIGRLMGNRDHSTIIYSVEKGRKRIESEESFNADYTQIKNMLLQRKEILNMNTVENILQERKKIHGSFEQYALINNMLIDIIRKSPNYTKLTDTERSSLDMIISKVTRILSGDPHFPDHWVDIAGYATLVVKSD